MPTLKRKRTSSTDESDFDSASPQSYAPRDLPHLKRPRFDLARNLSQMSLFEQARAPVQEPAEFQRIPTLSTVPGQDSNLFPSSSATSRQEILTQTNMDTEDVPLLTDIIQPIVEEPPDESVAIPEVRMRHTSSYEPEKDRIIITDLDSSEDEADTPPHTFSSKDNSYSVSPAVLARMNSSKLSFLKVVASTPESDAAKALVLFKPSPWSATDARELEGMYRARDSEKQSTILVAEVEEPDENAMEIE